MDKFYLEKEKTLLLIIDIQEKLLPQMKYGNQIIERTITLLTIANRINMPVVATQQYTKGLGNTVDEVSQNFNDVPVFEKMTFTGCTEEVKEELNKRGKNKIIVTGMETHVCVFQTVRDLLNEGYQVFVVSDAVCSRKKEDYFNGLALMQKMGAVVTNTESVFFDLMKEAGGQEFKDLAPLFK